MNGLRHSRPRVGGCQRVGFQDFRNVMIDEHDLEQQLSKLITTQLRREKGEKAKWNRRRGSSLGSVSRHFP